MSEINFLRMANHLIKCEGWAACHTKMQLFYNDDRKYQFLYAMGVDAQKEERKGRKVITYPDGYPTLAELLAHYLKQQWESLECPK